MSTMPRRVQNPHDQHLVRSWRRCRRGIGEVLSDPQKRDVVVRWIDDKVLRFNSPFLSRWRLIVTGGEPSLVEELTKTESFFDLPEDRRGEWGRLVQSHPFAPLLARDRASA